jgi:hypothetical protein
MRRMRWFKVAAIGVGILIAFLIVGSVVGAVMHLVIDVVIAAAVVGAIVVAVKVARSRREVSAKKAEREVREPDYTERSRPLPRSDIEPVSYSPPQTSRPQPSRPAAADVDDELARLKREMGSLALPVRLGELGHRRLDAVHPHPDRGPAAHHPHGELGRAADHGHDRGGVPRRDPV